MSSVQRCGRVFAWSAAAFVLAFGIPAVGGAAPAPLRVDLVNRSPVPLECHAIAGHWYGFDLGTVAAGASTALPLQLDRASGTISIPNNLHQPVPIQWIYCGRSGDAWRTRAVLPLRRLAEPAAAPTAIVCREVRRALRCD